MNKTSKVYQYGKENRLAISKQAKLASAVTVTKADGSTEIIAAYDHTKLNKIVRKGNNKKRYR